MESTGLKPIYNKFLLLEAKSCSIYSSNLDSKYNGILKGPKTFGLHPVIISAFKSYSLFN